jgi:hypothetical protein
MSTLSTILIIYKKSELDRVRIVDFIDFLSTRARTIYKRIITPQGTLSFWLSACLLYRLAFCSSALDHVPAYTQDLVHNHKNQDLSLNNTLDATTLHQELDALTKDSKEFTILTQEQAPQLSNLVWAIVTPMAKQLSLPKLLIYIQTTPETLYDISYSFNVAKKIFAVQIGKESLRFFTQSPTHIRYLKNLLAHELVHLYKRHGTPTPVEEKEADIGALKYLHNDPHEFITALMQYSMLDWLYTFLKPHVSPTDIHMITQTVVQSVSNDYPIWGACAQIDSFEMLNFIVKSVTSTINPIDTQETIIKKLVAQFKALCSNDQLVLITNNLPEYKRYKNQHSHKPTHPVPAERTRYISKFK